MSEGEKKYVVVGGWVHSKNDGQEHYVSSHQLCSLYKLSRKDCVCMEQKAVSFGDKYVFERYRREGYQILFPRYDGDYSLERECSNSSKED